MLLCVQNISFNVRAPNNASPHKDTSIEGMMLKLIGAETFLVTIQPAEKELQASSDGHAGPLNVEGESAPFALLI